jgi:hypothetical protein
MDMENIKKAVKESVLQNFMEAAKFARRGAEKQRPKSWSKGTKSGSDKRKMREEGKRDARDMNEAKSDDFFGTDSSGVTRGLDRNYGVEHEPDVESATSATHAHHFEPVDWQDRSKGLQYTKHSRLARHGIPIEMLDTGTLLPKSQHEAAFAQHPNALPYLRDVKNYHWDSYEWNRDAQLKGFSGAKANAAHHTRMGIATKGLIEKIRQGQIVPPQVGDVSEQNNYYYNKLKENNEIPRHARVTSDEEPDYYGELERERKAGTSGEEPREEPREEPNRPHTPESVAKLLQQAHKTALARTETAFGPGGKHAKQDPFYMIKHYADELDVLHTRVMGDASS